MSGRLPLRKGQLVCLDNLFGGGAGVAVGAVCFGALTCFENLACPSCLAPVYREVIGGARIIFLGFCGPSAAGTIYQTWSWAPWAHGPHGPYGPNGYVFFQCVYILYMLYYIHIYTVFYIHLTLPTKK